ncbi:DUF1740-domain-containing protein [Mollisia scopiformis]|uniref:DUF1740-domain-containing protein n=1 Tax=Mollisia scopiformis TaxID=149040 RepID=A0A194XM09_MOLSC|nr:DUF1740-domain-containing protein [Mollisia scopiformis]KUJ21119.1 DUF1740-domain-containing protein [Mollisia scopiformis]
MSEPQTKVPKFTSFRPRPLQPQEANPRSREEIRHSSRSEQEKDRKSAHHKRHRSRDRDRIHASRTNLEVSRVVPDETSSAVFNIDRKGDVKNLEYGSIHRYSVPAYHRFGGGFVLGASLDLKIDRDLDDGKAITLKNWKSPKFRGREKYVFSRVEKDKPRLLRLRPEVVAEVDNAKDTNANFISLQARGKKRMRGENGENASSDSEQDSRDYRSIYGKVKAQDQPQDHDMQYATESDDSGSDAGRAIRLDMAVRDKNVRLRRKVDECPHDIDAWLELIGHQDALISTGDNHRRITNAEIRSTADIKIHMYEKALEKTRSLADREKLLQELMAEGAKIWELQVQADRWEQIARENIDSLVLWTKYLDFKQSTFSAFRYEEIKEVYLSRIKLLLTAVEKSNNESADSFYQQVLYVLLRLTLFIRESGYSELSVAIWQGLLELNLCGPTSLLSKEEYINLFRQFWESEVPRLGEDGALGWRRYVDDETSSDVPEPITDEAQDPIRPSTIFKSWAAAERQRSKCSRTPARTMDEVAEDDPFRVILFSDIEELSILFPVNLRSLCVDAFLAFCRLPPTASDHELPGSWFMEQFIRNDSLGWDLAKFQQQLSVKAKDDTEVITLTSCFHVMYQSIRPLSLTDNTSYQITKWDDLYGGDTGPVPYQYIRNALKQLTQDSFTEGLAQYHMAFEYLNEPETIKKVAKSLLKRHPSSLTLYNAYALIEWSRGNKDVANGVFTAALNMNGSSSETESKPDSILTWKSLAWCCLEDGDKISTLRHLLSIPDGVPNSGVTPTPATLLRAKHHIRSTRDFLLSTGDPKHAVMYAECLTLLAYLSETSGTEPTSATQGDVTTALKTLMSFSKALATRNHTHHQEILLQSAARLLQFHCRNGPYRPSLIRVYLSNFLALFPQNTLFLALYTANEARLRVENRVRSLFLSTILIPENDCLTSRFFAIQYEMTYGNIHSVKSAFEKAVSAPMSRSSPGLWRFYLVWVVQNEKQLSKTGKDKSLAKDIWYRALRACPWAKELYILGFEMLGESGLEFEELRGTWKVMGEKDLRVHVDLDDELEKIEESRGQKSIRD